MKKESISFLSDIYNKKGTRKKKIPGLCTKRETFSPFFFFQPKYCAEGQKLQGIKTLVMHNPLFSL